jgi:hypothetical protein
LQVKKNIIFEAVHTRCALFNTLRSDHASGISSDKDSVTYLADYRGDDQHNVNDVKKSKKTLFTL